MGRFQKSAAGISASLKRMFIGMAAVGGAGVGLRKIVSAASDAEEILSKLNVVFGEMSGEARAWSEEFGQSVGRATQDVQKWMSGLQDTFVPLGIARREAMELSKALTSLAVDVASFNNKADEDVIRDFTSALVGNHETVRKYGVIIGEAAITQEALFQGMEKTYSQLTDLEKVQLRYALIVKGTSDAQGDAVRTGGSFANQMKRLRGNMTNLAETVGNVVLPRLAVMLKNFNRFLISIKSLLPGITVLIVQMGKWALSLFIIQGAIKLVRGFVMGLITAYKALAVAKAMVLAVGGPASIAILVGGIAAGTLAVANITAAIDGVVDSASAAQVSIEELSEEASALDAINKSAMTAREDEGLNGRTGAAPSSALLVATEIAEKQNKAISASADEATKKTKKLLDALQEEVWTVNMSAKAKRRYQIHQTTNDKAQLARADKLLGLLEHAKAMNDLDAINLGLQFEIDTFGLSEIEKKLYPLKKMAEEMGATELWGFRKRSQRQDRLSKHLTGLKANESMKTEADALLETLKGPAELFIEIARGYKKLRDKGFLNPEQFKKATDKLGERLFGDKDKPEAPMSSGQFMELDTANVSVAGLAITSVDPALNKMDAQLEESKKQTVELKKLNNDNGVLR